MYKWSKQTRKLTDDMKERGVIFASRLDRPGEIGVMHEVLKDDEDADRQIENLTDVSFFKGMAKDFGWSVKEIVWK